MSENDKAYMNEDSFSFHGTPDDIEVEVELNGTANTMSSYDPYRLAEVLVELGQRMTGIALYDYQKPMCFRIIYSILAKDGAEITGLFSRQSGKSEIVVFTSVTLAVMLPVLAKIFPNELGYFKNGIKMGLFAPQGEQVETVYRRCMTRLLSEPVRMFLDDPDVLDTNVSQVHFKLKSGSTLTGQSAAKQAKVESKSYSLVYIDESQEVDSEKVRKCVSGDNLVMLTDGTEKTLKEVYENRLPIAGHEGIIYPKQFYHNGIQDVFRITLTDGKYIDVTEEHKNKIIRRGKMDNKPFLAKTSELKVGDRLPIANEMPFFGNIGNYMEGLIIGYIMGDGYAKKGKVMFCGTKEVVKRLDYLVSKYGCKTYLNNFNTDNGLVEVSIVEDNSSGVKRRGYKGTNGIINLLKSYDVYGHTGKDKRIPDRSYSADFLKGVIEALIETDGSVFISSNKPHINFTNTSKHLTDFVQKSLHKFGVHGSILEKKNNGEFGKNPNNLHSFTIKDSRSIITFNHYFTLFSKQDKLRKCFDLALTKKNRNTCKYYPDSERYYKIVSIENIGKKDTYCIESDRDDHLWVVNGIITHNSIIPMTAATFGTIVRTGTPARKKGDFYETINNNKKQDKKLKSDKEKLKKQLHFQYNYQDVIASKKRQYQKDKQDFHLLYEKAVNRDKKSQGENSDSFRMSYKIEWLLEIGMFITEDALEEQCYAKRLGLPKLDDSDFVVAGLDIASARNNTVLTTAILDAPADDFGERPKKTILDWLIVGNTNYEELFHIVAKELIDKRVRVLFADYTGVGRALTDVLMHHLGEFIEIVPYTFSPASKSDMWKALDEDIVNRNIIIPAHKSVRDRKEFKQFEEEMTHLSKTWKGSFMVCEKTPGWNDDCCDSLGLMNLAGNYLYVPQTEMEVTDNTIINTRDRYNLKNQSRW